jgi:alpha-tubulin suppressor-like RCC1 family protein
MAVRVHINNNTHLTGAVEVAAGHNHSCALLSDGTVRCWGYNAYGEVGDNTTTNRSVATLVVSSSGSGTLSGVSHLSSGRFHSCALISDGSVYCWGDNDNGELGDGTTINRLHPVRAGEIATAITINAGEYHSCAALADGTAQCWGAAAFGQVGDGTTADATSPVTVIGPGGYGELTGVVKVSAGGGNWPDGSGTDNYEHTCALLSDGTVVSWGQNIYGQLGDGTTAMSISPVAVALL